MIEPGIYLDTATTLDWLHDENGSWWQKANQVLINGVEKAIILSVMEGRIVKKADLPNGLTRELRSRLNAAYDSLEGLAVSRIDENNPDEAARLRAKKEGVALAISYINEMIGYS